MHGDRLDLDLALYHLRIDPFHPGDHPAISHGDLGLAQPLTLCRASVEHLL